MQNVGFQKRLATAKQSEWYTSEIEGREQTNRDTTIGRYAEENGIDAQVTAPKKRKFNVRGGGDGENFATNRRGAWTH